MPALKKRCTICKQLKESMHFYAHAGGKYGIKSQCVVCYLARKKKAWHTKKVTK